MEFDEFKILVKGMKSAYTNERFLPDADSVKIWYQLIKDIDYESANAAIQKYILTNKFPPTIADIRELSAEVKTGRIPDWGDGWEQVITAIRKYGMYQEGKAMESMDEITRKTVKRLGFKNICLSENINHDRANFRMIYEQIAERKQNDSKLPVSLKNRISSIQETMMIEVEHDES